MAKHLVKLTCSFQDMRDRYGDNDPVVVDIKAAIEKYHALVQQTPGDERRQNRPGERFWNYRLQRRHASYSVVSEAIAR